MRLNKKICFALFLILTFNIFAGCVQETNSYSEISNPNSDVNESSAANTSATEGSSDEASQNNTSTDDNDGIPQEPKDEIISFLACPDNIIHPSVYYDAIDRAAKKNNVSPDYSDLHNATYDFEPIYQYVAEAMKSANITYINQETLIGGTSGQIHGYPVFNSPAAVADTVIGLGVDVVNVAHNHMLDSRNTKYLENCNNVFESAGIDVIGYYPDQESTKNITVIEKKGIKISFLSYTYGTNGLRLPDGSSFVIPYLDENLITQQVTLAKSISDVVIVSCHWGYEDTFNANTEQKKYAQLMADLGVDVILGMHPHVIQPMKWINGESGNKTLLVYSLGNFVSGMVAGKNMLAGMLSLDIKRDGKSGEITIESPLFIPIVTHYEKESRVASNDTGYRNFKIYYLSDYTEELAATHGVCQYERKYGSTLVGGKFSKDTLLQTLYKYIPTEFLPKEYQTTNIN